MNLLDIYKAMNNDGCYYLDKPVKIIRVIEEFHLAKVKYKDNSNIFFIDISALSDTPSTEKCISINLFKSKK